MKAAAIAIGALLALSTAAFAGEESKRPAATTVKPAGQEQLDMTTTGSVPNDARESAKKPRLGIDLNPFSFGTFH